MEFGRGTGVFRCLSNWFRTRLWSTRTRSCYCSFKVLFNLLERLSLSLWQKECRCDEVDDRKPGKEKEHRRITILARDGEEEHGQGRRYELIDYERDTHTDR